jgi:integrase
MSDDEETHVAIPAALAKTREPFETVLPPSITALLRAYVQRILGPMTKGAPKYLFDNGTGRPKPPVTLSWLIQRTTKRHIGIAIAGHQFRHVLAKTLREGGVDYETIRQLLGHRSMAITVNFYAGLDRSLAARRHSSLLAQRMREAHAMPAKKLGAKKSRRRDREGED